MLIEVVVAALLALPFARSLVAIACLVLAFNLGYFVYYEPEVMNPNAAPPATRAELLQRIATEPVLTRLFEQVRGLSADDAAHDVEHLLRVALLMLKLGGEQLEPRAAVCAALLHDVVNVPKNHPERARASQWSAAKARELLAGESLPAQELDEIVEAIEDHSYSSGRRPRSLLGEALQDADRLEALGALGIARTFSTGVRLGSRYFHSDDPWADTRALDDRAYSVDHFFTKLLKLPETLCTPAGRVEAERRAEILRAFLLALAEEIGAPLPRSRLDREGHKTKPARLR